MPPPPPGGEAEKKETLKGKHMQKRTNNPKRLREEKISFRSPGR
jgi:hypothetical protein